MLKKRLIFTLLYDHEQFMLSRNFRLQKVGNLEWLQINYDFSHISFSIDELIVLDVTRGEKNTRSFCKILKELTRGCFVPIAAGGGVRTISHARSLLHSGADKVVINTALYDDLPFVNQLASAYGQQCVVASIDIRRGTDGCYRTWKSSGTICNEQPAEEWILFLSDAPVGEIYLNSMDRDGTGQGYDMQVLDLLPSGLVKPLILAGGVGNAAHLLQGLQDPRVDAVATANLFNFIGDGLKRARASLITEGIELPVWDFSFLEEHLARR